MSNIKEKETVVSMDDAAKDFLDNIWPTVTPGCRNMGNKDYAFAYRVKGGIESSNITMQRLAQALAYFAPDRYDIRTVFVRKI